MSAKSLQASYPIHTNGVSSTQWLKWFIILLLFSLSVAGISYIISMPSLLPIKNIRVQGAFVNITENMLRESVGHLDEGFFSVDVANIKQKVELLPWVAQANIRRVWPDTLLISVAEQTAVAVWNQDGLMNQNGELFQPDKSTFPELLPTYTGPPDTERQVRQLYLLAYALLDENNIKPVMISMDARRSLLMKLDNNIYLILGRERFAERITRFSKLYSKVLAAKAEEIEKIDMRYTNGMAITWRHRTGLQG